MRGRDCLRRLRRSAPRTCIRVPVVHNAPFASEARQSAVRQSPRRNNRNDQPQSLRVVVAQQRPRGGLVSGLPSSRNHPLHVAARSTHANAQLQHGHRVGMPTRHGMRVAWTRFQSTLRRAPPLTFATRRYCWGSPYAFGKSYARRPNQTSPGAISR